MKAIFTTRWARIIELLLVTLILLITFCTGLENIEFFPDESEWIATSVYLELFTSGNFTDPLWSGNSWTHDNPPVSRYMIGIGRLMGGFHREDLNPPWDFSKTDQFNIAKGRQPNPNLLWWSRLIMAISAAAAGLILFELVRSCANRAAAYAFLLLFASNPYFLVQLRRAMSETPLLLWLVLAAISVDQALRKYQAAAAATTKKRRAIIRACAWFCLAAICGGLAGAAKMNGGAVAIALVVLWILANVIQPLSRSRLKRLTMVAGISIGLVTLMFATFVIVNPYLYKNPIGRTLGMLNFRIWLVQRQQTLTNAEITSMAERVRIVPQRVLEDYASIHFSGALMINLLLSIIGAGSLLRKMRDWIRRRGGPNSTASPVIVAFGIVMSVPALLTPLDWDRYYLMPVVFSTICIAIATAQIVVFLLHRVQQRFALLAFRSD